MPFPRGLFLAADAVVNILSLAFFSPHFKFNVDLIVQNLLLLDGHNFTRSPFDFIVLFLIRVLSLVVASLLIAFDRDSKWTWRGTCPTSQPSNCLPRWLLIEMPLPRVGLVGLFLAANAFVNIISLAFFSPHFKFNADLIVHNLLLLDGYRFLRSPFDFIVLFLIRVLSLVVASLLIAFDREKIVQSMNLPCLGFSILTFSFTIVKLLAFAEHPEQLAFFGLWFLFAWSFVVCILFCLLWYLTLSATPINYERFFNEGEEAAEGEGAADNCTSSTPLADGSASANDEEQGILDKVEHLSTYRHVARLVAYCFAHWPWFGSGFFFLFLYSGGVIVSRLTSDCQTIAGSIGGDLNIFLRNGIMLIGSLGFMFTLSWRLTLVTFIAIPPIAYITKVYGVFFDKLYEKLQATIAMANHTAEEVLSTMRTVRSFACEKKEAARFETMLDSTLAVARRRAIVYVGNTFVNEFTNSVILVAVLLYGGHLIIDGAMSSEDFFKFLLYQMQLGENLYSIGYVFTGLMSSVGASRKVFEYMRRLPKIPNDGRDRRPVQGELKMENVHFTYPSRPKNPVLNGLTLHIRPGETLALVGPSAGGKSSIVSLFEHFYEPEQGEITLDGVPIAYFDHAYYHQKIALVAQEPILYDGSVRSNIAYGCEWATEDDIIEAAKAANVHNFVMELEKGYDSNCGEKGVQMSGGQKQRIAIARALLRKPAVLILDEATSALDAESENLVQEAINQCTHERTVLVIAHRLSTIEKADRIAVINKGTVVQLGSHAELMEDQKGLYYCLVSRQLASDA